jgi:serine/threonine protein kinase
MMWFHVKQPPPPPKSLNDSIPNWLNSLTLRMLAKSPKERPGSAGEIAELIEKRRQAGGLKSMDSASGSLCNAPIVEAKRRAKMVRESSSNSTKNVRSRTRTGTHRTYKRERSKRKLGSIFYGCCTLFALVALSAAVYISFYIKALLLL